MGIDPTIAQIVALLALFAHLVYGENGYSVPTIDDKSGQSCTFGDYIINSSTISKFPIGKDYCYRVDGPIRIDETSNVTHEELFEVLSGLEIIAGSLEIVNTGFKNLSFFGSLFGILSTRELYSFGYDLIIVNNSQLETMAGGALLTINPSVQIEKNPLLDPNCSHVLQYYPDKRRIRGNRSNCGCELDVSLTNTNVNDVEDNCTAIIGNLYLFGPNVPSAEILKRKFGNVYLVSGEIAVVNTDYDDLKFLGNLQSVEFYYSRMWPNALERFVRIENNTALKTLSWPKLKEVVSATILITNNPNLCYSVFELNGLLESRFVDQINGKVCEEIHPSEDGARVCRIGEAATVSNIPGNCQILVGDLTIDQSSPEEELWKLYNVTRIYGSLTIRNSSLIGFSSMWKLRDVYNLAGRSALVIDSNTYLKSIYLMYIFRISSELPVRITDNKRLDMSPAECDLLSDSGRIEYDGNKRDCSALMKRSYDFNGKYVCILLLLNIFLYIHVGWFV